MPAKRRTHHPRLGRWQRRTDRVRKARCDGKGEPGYAGISWTPAAVRWTRLRRDFVDALRRTREPPPADSRQRRVHALGRSPYAFIPEGFTISGRRPVHPFPPQAVHPSPPQAVHLSPPQAVLLSRSRPLIGTAW